MNGDTAIIICSYLGSKRISGKAFRRVAGIPAVEILLRRLAPAGLPIVLAVPSNEVEHYQKALGHLSIPQFIIMGGNPDSPLHRMADYLEINQIQYVVRITHDDILTDVKTMVDMIDTARANDAGYVYCSGIVRGADVEVIHRDNILGAARNRREPTEYVSYFVRGNTQRPVIDFKPRAAVRRPYRLTMDYESDAMVLEIVLRRVGYLADVAHICGYLDLHPELIGINRLPEVTVYTCVRDCKDYITAAMTSVFCQNRETEYIIIDDLSSDETINEIFKCDSSKKARVIMNQKNLGLAASSNIAIEKARGKYIVRLDADDSLMPHALDVMFRRMEETHALAIYPAYHTMGEPSDDSGNPRNFHHAGCAMMRTDVLKEFRFKDGLMHWDSAELFDRMMKRGKIEYIDEPLWFYRKHAKSLSASNPEERQKIRTGLGI